MVHEEAVFRRSSATYYVSSRLFPKRVRADVFRLYGFLRTADDCVDTIPAQPERLLALEQRWDTAWSSPHATMAQAGATTDDRMVQNMVQVARTYDFDPEWISAFFVSMKADMYPKEYATLEDTLAYTYGTAEVIGLMMAKLLDLPEAAFESAKMQGRAMQFINFIRDIDEDNKLGRCYFPVSDVKQYSLPDLTEATARKHPEQFRQFIDLQLDRYRTWQTEAMRGYQYIPRRYLLPIRVAADMYDWTARSIEEDPYIVFAHKVKPSKHRVLRRAIARTLS